ncbi:hypothetical protein [Thiorhodococcus minor]|uniref:Uncharacterized protein n=1 Tax=Thiorhodococcus minor TaxID=57489 RepID=A0A6M0K975_9GAMM|nr:hypothetical protein [Thiorhodococcus minor]NEV65025.1 hypothetical protein [Thiorhodococcus minor]
MRVLIDAAFFAGHEADELAFLELFSLAHDGRHLLLTAPAFGPDGPREVLDWLAGLPEVCCRQIKQVLEQGVRAASGLPADAVGVRLVAGSSSDWPAGRLCLQDARRLLQTPLGVMVENRRADWRFLLALAPPAQRYQLQQALDHGWLEILHAGGLGEMKAWLEELLDQPFTYSSNATRLLRLWVMFDRDADPADRSQPSQESIAMKTLCESAPARPWTLGHYRLGRRTIENYLPEAALRRWQSERSGAEGTRRREVVDAFCKLRRDQPAAARQYPMKSGLLADLSDEARKDVEGKPRRIQDLDLVRFNQLSAADHARLKEFGWLDGARRWIQDADLDPLFQGLSDTDRKALRKGFGGKIATYLENVGEAEFRHEFERHLAQGEPDRETILNTLFARL